MARACPVRDYQDLTDQTKRAIASAVRISASRGLLFGHYRLSGGNMVEVRAGGLFLSARFPSSRFAFAISRMHEKENPDSTKVIRIRRLLKGTSDFRDVRVDRER